MNIVKKILIGCGILFVLLFIAALFTEDETKPTATAQKATIDQDVEDDRKQYSEFYQQLIQKTKEADNEAEPFFAALQREDVVTATQLAMNTKYRMYDYQSQINEIKVPKLNDKEARKLLEEAKKIFADVYLGKATLMSNFIEFADNQSVKKAAELKDTGERVQARITAGAANLVAAGAKLGVKLPQTAKTN